MIDFAGLFEPASSSGEKYILILVDAATKWPEAIAMTSQRAEKVADEMIKLFSKLVLPKVIKSDLGYSFKSELLTKFESELGVKPCFSTSYLHQPFPSAERFVGTLKNMLRKFVSDGPRSWDKMIDLLMFAYRDAPCVATGFFPFELIYGRTAMGPLQVVMEELTQQAVSGKRQSVVKYLLDLRKRLKQCSELASEYAMTL